MTDSGPRPTMVYWHLCTDETGVSHQRRCELSGFELKGVGPAEPQWNDKQPRSEATMVFTVQPVGWVGDWHENPAPQWIVPLSGRWWVEAMDGTRVEMGPGELSFGEDQSGTQTPDGRRGHRSGTIGDQPAVLMTVQLQLPSIRRPCHFAYADMAPYETLEPLRARPAGGPCGFDANKKVKGRKRHILTDIIGSLVRPMR